RRAVLTLHAESLVPEVSGSGLVVRQDPLPGSVVSHGATVRLQLDRRSLDQKATVSPKGSPSLAAAVPRRPHEP
ncbi:MAG: PASTA domain-containing protein, partial [Myxococcales bacterium]|nr:PASTA domain-containing protein [Myxococcales bacterium]